MIPGAYASRDRSVSDPCYCGTRGIGKQRRCGGVPQTRGSSAYQQDSWWPLAASCVVLMSVETVTGLEPSACGSAGTVTSVKPTTASFSLTARTEHVMSRS